MQKIYAGIGSRETPNPVLSKIIVIAQELAEKGWILRSGGADGADWAFEQGCDLAKGEKQIYLPWKGFNGSNSNLHIANYNCPQREAAEEIAANIHPNWKGLKYGAKLLHTRNVFQILGWDLNSPSGLVVAWTLHGREVGGTRTALVLAKQYDIPIINLAVDKFDIAEYLK